MAYRISASNPLILRLVEAGIVPDNCRRFVIDCEVDKPPRLLYECYGDDRLLAILTDPAIVTESVIPTPPAKERAGGERADTAASPPPYREGFEL